MVSTIAAALAGALLAGSALAKPVAVRSNDIARRTPAPQALHCAKEWSDFTLFAGVCPALTGGVDVDADVGLDLSLHKAAVNGDIFIGLTDDFLVAPTISLDLSGLEAYVELDLSASASVYESVELLASAELELAVPGLLQAGVKAGLCLDLLVGVSAAIELETGFHLTFPQGSLIELSLLTHEIVSGSLGGVVATALPLGLGAHVDLTAAVELVLGLRLRAVVGVEAAVDVLGLDIGAGLEAAIYVNLYDYTEVIVSTKDCPLSLKELLCLKVGIAVDLDVDIAHTNVLDISLAPTLMVGIAAATEKDTCLPTINPCARCEHGGGHDGGDDDDGDDNDGDDDDGDDNDGDDNDGDDNDGDDNDHHSHSIPSASVSLPHPGHSDKTVTATATATATGHGHGPHTTSAAHPTLSIPAGNVPTTIYETQTYTVTQCAVTVPNCPAGHTQKVITSVVKSTVTYCPVGETGVPVQPPAMTTPVSVNVPKPSATNPVTLTDIPATTYTYTPPVNAPTPVPTVVVPDSPVQSVHPTLPAGSASAPAPEGPAPTHADTPVIPAPGHSDSPAPVASHSDCIGCVGPVTGVPSKPSSTTLAVKPTAGNPAVPTAVEMPPAATSSAAPEPPISNSAASTRFATGAAGVVAVAILAMI